MLIERKVQRPLIVIIGGGFAGINLAKSFRNKNVEVLVLDRHNYHTFQPLLYQVATGGIEAESIAFPLRRMFDEYENINFRLVDVKQVIPETNTVETDKGSLVFDYLIIATGATTNFMGNKEIEHFSMPMKSIPEAMNFRSMILQNFEAALVEPDVEKKKALVTFVIVGGGPTGVEMAGALAEFKNHILCKDYRELDKNFMKVILIESKPRLLAGFSEDLSAAAAKALTEMGVELNNGVRVSSYDGDNLQINDGRSMHVKNVFWAAGVVGEVLPGIPADKVVRGNRIQTDDINRVKDYQNIFAIGDVAAVVTEETPEGHPGVAQVAIQQGKHLGKNIMALIEGRETIPFNYNDKGSLATIGKNKAVAELGKVKFKGFVAWIIWCFVHLFSLVGTKNKVLVFMNWMVRYFTYNGSTRLIIRRFNSTLMTEDPGAR